MAASLDTSATTTQPPFWETTALAQMSRAQWEALCDGCGRCCLIKYQDEDTAEVFYTDVACRLLDAGTCRCRAYAQRSEQVADCVVFDAAKLAHWLPALPESCAYRRLSEGRGLADWHPLVSGDPQSVHRAGMSVREQVLTEEAIHPDELVAHIVIWPEAPE